ncbi:MAG: nitrogenase-stabilizing/protective protein NifW [Anaeromyxobacteraceae bacterium]
MRTLESLSTLESAEELLEFFGIEYDPEVLAPRRVRLLKRYGMSVAMIDRITAPLTGEERLALHAEALAGQWERLVLETTCASTYYAKKDGGCAACGAHAAHAGQAA